MIEYRVGNALEVEQVVELYEASTLGERRPSNDRARMKLMLDNANLVVTAWDGPMLVGISRSFSDFTYVTYLADLAVRVSHQRMGIGKELMRRTRREGGEQTMIVLLAAPKAVDYYPHAGFDAHNSAWILRPGKTI